MEAYKKRIRILAEKLGFDLVYQNRWMILRHHTNSIAFLSTSKQRMTCEKKRGAEKFAFEDDKEFVFDHILSCQGSQPQKGQGKYDPLPNCSHRARPLSLEDYVREERAAGHLQKLRDRIARQADQTVQLGGNRYFAEYHRGIMILTDDLGSVPSNVVEFVASPGIHS